MLKIVKINKGIFTVFEKSIKGSEITLNFNPFVKKNNLTEGLIVHLRARPPQQACHWTYGIYEVEYDNYLSIDNIKSMLVQAPNFFSDCIPNLETKPTHVLIYPFAKAENAKPGLITFKDTNAVAKVVQASTLGKRSKT